MMKGQKRIQHTIIIIMIIHTNRNNDCNRKENDCREKTTYWRGGKKSDGKNN